LTIDEMVIINSRHLLAEVVDNKQFVTNNNFVWDFKDEFDKNIN